MADTGWKFPGTMDGARNGTGTAWTNPDNAKADDTSDARAALGAFQASDHLAASNFDFSSIPAGATIDGIEVRLGDYVSSASISISGLILILADDSDGTENKASEISAFTGSRQTDEAGGAADLWSETITRADVQDVDWGWAFNVLASIGGANADVDFMQMKVYYTAPPVIITDVNTTESWDDGDTGLVITGTGFL